MEQTKELISNWFMDKMNLSLNTEQLNDLCSKIDNQARINFVRCSTELPNIYEGSLNSERIKQVNNLKELYTINGTTISDIFCRGVNWYKQKLSKQAITYN